MYHSYHLTKKLLVKIDHDRIFMTPSDKNRDNEKVEHDFSRISCSYFWTIFFYKYTRSYLDEELGTDDALELVLHDFCYLCNNFVFLRAHLFFFLLQNIH